MAACWALVQAEAVEVGVDGQSVASPAANDAIALPIDEMPTDEELTPMRQLLAPVRDHLLLAPVRDHLLHAAESGLATASPDPIDWDQLAEQVGSAGLVALAGSLAQAPQSGDTLLRAAYTVSLYWRAG